MTAKPILFVEDNPDDELLMLRALRKSKEERELTSSREERDLSESDAAGANSFIRKPVDFERFVEVVQAVCGYWARLNEPPPQAPFQSSGGGR